MSDEITTEKQTRDKELKARMAMDTKESKELSALVTKRWGQGEDFLRKARKDYQLNLSFYLGDQWVTWDRFKNRVESLPPRFSETDRYRTVSNQIEPRIDTLLGVLTERDLTFEGDPTDADDQSIAGSQLSEAILEAARQNDGWENLRREAIMALLLGGCAAVALEWDESKGERLWVNEGNNDVIGTGEVSLSTLTIEEFTVEPGSRTPAEANWWVGLTSIPCAQAREKYGLNWTPEADLDTATNPTVGKKGNEQLCAVYVMYERPNNKCKDGRCVVVVNGIAVKNYDWDFPFNDLNLIIFRQGFVPGQWNGKTFVTAARPVQVLYNAARSSIAEHMKLATNARLMIPHGAMDDINELTDEPGSIHLYHHEQNMPAPGSWYMAAPQVNPTLLEECERLEKELDNILHAHDVARGVAPGDRNSGLALSILAEKNNTPLGPMTHDQADGWSRIGTMVLKLYAKNVDSEREATIVSKNGIPQKWSWQGTDLRGQTHVRVPIDAVAPHTRAQMLAQLQNLQQLNPAAFGALPHEKIITLLGLSSSRELTQGLRPDVAKAHRENDRMASGQPDLPEKFDDHAIHIAEHNAFRKSTAFEVLPDEIKTVFEHHIQAHQTLSQEELMGQASLNAVQPGLGALPQAHDPMGSAVPEPFSLGQGAPVNENAPMPQGPPQ